jgi:hypothetical protein
MKFAANHNNAFEIHHHGIAYIALHHFMNNYTAVITHKNGFQTIYECAYKFLYQRLVANPNCDIKTQILSYDSCRRYTYSGYVSNSTEQKVCTKNV